MLEVRDLVKKYGARAAVDGVSFDVAPGEIFGLLGPNGAGKSTTLEIAIGLRHPTSGTVRVAGEDPRSPDVRRKIGLAPQDLALYEELSAEANLKFFGRMIGLRGTALVQNVDRVLEIAELDGRRRDRVSTFSGGMQRRLNLAIALIGDPDFLLLDEPTAGVDPQSRDQLLSTIEGLRHAGCGIVYTTHYMEEAQRICDRVGILDHGKLLAVGTTETLVESHASETRITVTRRGKVEHLMTRNPLAALAPFVEDNTVESVKINPPDLEAVFLELTGRALRDDGSAA